MKRYLKTLFAILALSIGVSAFAQNATVRGTVVSADDGEAISFASIAVKGSSKGVLADVKGAFVIEKVPPGGVLIVSSVGYRTEEIAVDGRKNITVTLTRDRQQLDETIFVAYGTAKKASFTGSAAVVDNVAIERRINSSISKAIEGTAPGVMVTAGSGQPGESAGIRIRGYGSINATSGPLYVVDGVPYDGAVSAINNSDVESITILKDASAGALYGARGANGVVLITTKQGKAGALNVSYTGTVCWTNPALKYYDRVNSKDYVQLSYEALRNDFLSSGTYTFDEASQKARETMSGNFGGEIYNPFKAYTWDTVIGPDGFIQADAKAAWEEDWLKNGIVRSNAPRHEHQLSVSGGNDKMKTFMSLGYMNENGYVHETGFERFSGRVKTDMTPSHWFATGLNLSMAQMNRTGSLPTGDSYGNAILYAQRVGPIYPVYAKDAEGKTIYDAAGKAQYDYGTTRPWLPGTSMVALLYDDDRSQVDMNEGVRTYIKLGSDSEKAGYLQGLKLTFNLGADNRDIQKTMYNNMNYGNYASSNGRLYRYATRTTSYTLNELLTYNRAFGLHTLDVLAGHEFYKYNHKYLEGSRTNLVEGIEELRPGTANIDNDSYENNYAVESWLSRLNYNFDEKYYLSASFRRDGSSRFHADNRWGNFWSIGGNWRISKESFMKGLSFLDNMNIKASYGLQGNDDLDTYYAWQSLYSIAYANQGKNGALVSSLESKDITWEKNANFNVGFDARLFGGRLDVSAEYYSRKTTDMLLNYPMALSTGFSGYDANVGSMVNKGFEWSLGAVLMDKKDFFWKATLMGSTVRNKILKLTTESPRIISGQQVYEEGRSIYTFYMVKHAGVNPENGNELFWTYDLDADGKMTNERKTESYSEATATKYYVGCRVPKVTGSFGMDFEILRRFDVNILTSFSLGGKLYDTIYNSLLYPKEAYAFSSKLLDRWQKEGDVTDVPKMSYSRSAQVSDRSLLSASYFSIKTISLGYTLPAVYARKVGASKIRVFTTFDNLKMFAAIDGLNPQYSFGGTTGYAYYPSRSTVIGVNLNF